MTEPTKREVDMIRLVFHGNQFSLELENLIEENVISQKVKKDAKYIVNEIFSSITRLTKRMEGIGQIDKFIPIFSINTQLYGNIDKYNIVEKDIINNNWIEIEAKISEVLKRNEIKQTL